MGALTIRVTRQKQRASERAALTETTLETNNLRAPDESRFPLTSNEILLEGEFHAFCY